MAANNDLTKSPYKKEVLGLTQALELARCTADPKYFIKNFCYIQHPIKVRLPFDLYKFQEDLIDVYHGYRNSIAMMPRQVGKSTCAGAYLLWYAMFVADSTILIAAHKYSGAQEIMSRIRYMYESCPDHIRAGTTAYNRGSIEFDNGSRIISQATTEKTGRGMAISLLYCDELSFVAPRIAEEFWTSISPTLSTGGKCLITSTPNQDNDQFAKLWRGAAKTFDEYGNEQSVGVNGFKSFKSHWRDHPDRDDAWATEERNKIGEERFRREMELEFISFDETLIDSIFLSQMHLGIDPFKKTGQIRWYAPLNKNKTYSVSLDPSIGTGGDFAAIQVISLPDLVQVAEWQHNKTAIPEQIKLLKSICDTIKEDTNGDSEIYWSVENNTIGEAALTTIREMGEENIPGTFLNEPRKAKIAAGKIIRRGFHTNNSNKVAACSKLKQWIEKDKLKINSKNLVRELKTFVAAGPGYKAKPGETDDLVMALVINIRMIEVISRYDDDTYDYVRESFDDSCQAPMPIGFL